MAGWHWYGLALAASHAVAIAGLAGWWLPLGARRGGLPMLVLIAVLVSAAVALAAIRRARHLQCALLDCCRELQAREARFLAFIEHLPGQAYEKDRDGRYVFLGGAGVERGPKLDEPWLGRSDRQLWPHAAERRMAGDRRVLEEGREVENFIEIPGSDGPQHLLDIKYPLRDERGAVVALGGLAIDVTAQQRAIEELTRSEQCFRQLTENIREVFWLASLDWRQIHYVSPAYEDVWGRPCEMLYRRPLAWLDAVIAADREAVLERLRELSPDEFVESLTCTYRIQRPDGALRTIESRWFPVRNEAGEVYRIAGIAEDVTQRQHVASQLAAAQERAEAASRAKSAFLAHMSHEIRTPLTAILGFAEILLEQRLPELQNDAARTIRRNGEHLLRLINEVLDLSRIEAGKLDVQPVPCSPWEVLQGVIELLQAPAAEKGLRLTVAADGPLPARVLTDPMRLRQILINLVGNAVKFTETGEVHVALTLADEGGRRMLEFHVRDTGIGLSPEQLGRLFAPFSQGHASISRRYGGSGLGLAISRRLAELLGGAIRVSSTPGKGSCFVLAIAGEALEGSAEIVPPELPRVGHGTTSADAPLAGRRVLVVEDGPDNQRLLAHVLRRSGAEVMLAENGLEALEKALATRPGWGRRRTDRRQAYDLILMDVQMPVMDGLEATARLREQGYHGPIIAVTAHAMPHDVQKCLAAGCNAHLPKPIDRRQLLSVAAEWLDAARERDGNVKAVAGKTEGRS